MRFLRCILCFMLATISLPAQAAEQQLTRWRTVTLSEEFYSEGATAADFNRDGQTDIVAGPFWYEGPDFKARHAIYDPKPFDPHGYSDNFFAYAEDVNGDGWQDVLIYGFPGQDASWFENPKGQDRYWPRHRVLSEVSNESPTYVDIDGDGKQDIVCSLGGHYGYATRAADDPFTPWRFHKISDDSAGGRFTHGMGVGDVNGDGRLDLLEKNGWWEQPASLDGDPQWKKHAFAFSGPGGAQMYAYDLDGDGDNDVITSLAAHGYGVVWFEHISQGGQIDFKQHVIVGSTTQENRYGVRFSQPHAIELADIDGDGVQDIVTGKRYWAHGPHGDAEPNAPAVLYWFRTVRDNQGGVDFVPQRIHDNSGIGVEVKARDVNGDGNLDIVVGNKKGAFVHIQSRESVTPAEYQRAQALSREQAAQPSREGLPENAGLEPAAAAAAMTVPAGFHVQLAAGEPLVHQPVAFAIDHRGRLWIAEAYTYPRRAPEGQGKDRIIILEDQNGDGSFETRKVFTEGLNLVSGLEVGFGGVWVGAAPYLMFIADRDGDDKPDAEPQILLDGWGYQDTHETLNSFIWGPDGWLYGCQGVFTHSRIGKPGCADDERVPLNACVWRYHPVRHEFEIFARGSSNPWGVDFNDYGQSFITACVIPHLYHVIQGARYQRQGGQHFNPYVFDDIKTIARHRHYTGEIRDHAWWGRNDPVAHLPTDKAGGGHAHCGAMIYLGDNWPDEYRNQIFMNNVHGNRINNDSLERLGSGYVGDRLPDFLFANDRWYRGINLKYGPDGAVYLIDWYDKNACHRTQTEIWDRTNGRVFRVSYGDKKPVAVDVTALSDLELVRLHLHRNDWYVRHARQTLQERQTQKQELAGDARAELLAMAREQADVTRRLRALWTCHALGLIDDELALQTLDTAGSAAEYARAWMIQLALEDGAISEPILHKLESLAVSDPSPVVRLYLASALQRLPLAQRWKIAEGLVSHGDDANDHNLPLMIWYGVEPLVPADPARATQLAEASHLELIVRFIYRRAAAEPETLRQVLASLDKTTDAARLELMLDEITSIVRNQGRLTMPARWPDIYAKLAQHPSEKVRQLAQFITIKFGDKSIFPALRSIVADAKSAEDGRRRALEALVSGSDQGLPPVLFSLLDAKPLRGEAIRALARFDHPQTPVQLIAHYDRFDDSEKADAISTLGSRVDYAHALLDGVQQKKIPSADLSAVHVNQMQQLNDPKLLEKLQRVWGAIRSTPAEIQAEIVRLKKTLSADTLSKADLSHGRELFHKTCAKCHKLFDAGGEIGPNITGSNRANLDYILGNILDPNSLVGRDYQMTIFELESGRIVSGLIKEENATAVVVQTANDKVVIPKEEIDQRTSSTKSIMPEGQLKPMSATDVRDLVAYLGTPTQVPLPGEGPVYLPALKRVSGALEGEALKLGKQSGGDARPQTMGNFRKGQWSGTSQLWWTGAKVGDRLELTLPVTVEAEYEIYTVLTKAPDYGIVRLSLDGKQIGDRYDLYDPEVVTSGVLSLGKHHLAAGEHTLQVEILGANPQAVKAYMFGLDYVYLARKVESPDAAN